MIHDITNFEIINEIKMDGAIIDNGLVLSSDDVLTQVNYLIFLFHILIMFQFDLFAEFIGDSILSKSHYIYLGTITRRKKCFKVLSIM